MGGAMNIITNDPTQQREVSANVHFGNYNELGAQGVLNIPLSSNWAARFAVNSIRHDGYFNSNQSAQNETSLRAKLLYKPSETFSLLFSSTAYNNYGTVAGKVLVTATNTQVRDWYTPASSAEAATAGLPGYEPAGGTARNHYQEYHLRLDWDVGFGKLTYIPSYTSFNSFNVGLLNFANYAGREEAYQPYNRATSHELRLASTSDSKLTWQAGAFWFSNQYQYRYRNLGPVSANNINNGALTYTGVAFGGTGTNSSGTQQFYDFGSSALFGQATYAFTDTTRLTAGLRFTRDTVNQRYVGLHEPINPALPITIAVPPLPAVGGATDGSVNDLLPRSNSVCNATFTVCTPYEKKLVAANNRTDWKLRVEHDFSSDNMLYASVATGFRPPSATTGVAYQAESMTAYEIGSKNRFAGGRLQVNGGVFYYRYPIYQVAVFFPNPNNSSDIMFVPAASPATIKGAELELVWQFTAHDKLTLNPSYLSGKLDNDVSVTDPYQVTPGRFARNAMIYTSGKDLPHMPKLSISGGYEHTFGLAGGGNLTLHADAFHQSEQYTDYAASIYGQTQISGTTGLPVVTAAVTGINNVVYQKAYTIYNATLVYEPSYGKYQISLYGRNLGNQIVKLTANVNAQAAYVNDPRTFGMAASVKF
jgi:iron complex outermembrane receptor protein